MSNRADCPTQQWCVSCILISMSSLKREMLPYTWLTTEICIVQIAKYLHGDVWLQIEMFSFVLCIFKKCAKNHRNPRRAQPGGETGLCTAWGFRHLLHGSAQHLHTGGHCFTILNIVKNQSCKAQKQPQREVIKNLFLFLNTWLE